MEEGKVGEAWAWILWMYREARGVQSPPTTEALYEVTVEQTELYRFRPLEGLRVPLLVLQANIKDGIPMEAEVAEEVRGLKGGRLGVPSGMCAEDLKEWIREATHKKEPARRRWEILVRLVHRTFGDETPIE